MRAHWEALQESLMQAVRTLDAAQRFNEAKQRKRALARFADAISLLEYLMHHAEEVVTRTQIREHVWDWQFDGSSNVVDVYVRYLRDKIDRPFSTALIRTVRGVGYAIAAR